MTKRVAQLTVASAALMAMACGAPRAADPRMLSEWLHLYYGAIRVERMSPPVAARLMTYTSAARYSAMAAVDRTMPSLDGVLNGFPAMPAAEPGARYDQTLIAVAAERIASDSFFVDALPTTRAALSRLADSLEATRASVSRDVAQRSRELGARIGNAIVAWAHTDGFDSTRTMKYVARTGPGQWINDSPANWYATQNMSGASNAVVFNNPANVSQAGTVGDRALVLSPPKKAGIKIPAANAAGVTEPYWGTLRPFALSRWDECPADPAPMYGISPGTPLYEQARAVRDTAARLTAEQRATVFYWADNPGESGTPAGHWISIAAQLVSERQMSAAEAARVILATSVALNDAFIASWGYKFKINLIRPRTYIRAVMDSTWEPVIPTPPFPEYMSGHSTVSSAAATVMTSMIGVVPFTDSTSVALGHPVRHFESFMAAAEEAGMSRVYGGLHYPVANTVGRSVGRCVGEKVTQRFAKTARAATGSSER